MGSIYLPLSPDCFNMLSLTLKGPIGSMHIHKAILFILFLRTTFSLTQYSLPYHYQCEIVSLEFFLKGHTEITG